MQKKWKYDDILCSGCGEIEETGEEILSCKSFGGNLSDISYSLFFSDNVENQISVAKQMMIRKNRRKKIREEIT